MSEISGFAPYPASHHAPHPAFGATPPRPRPHRRPLIIAAAAIAGVLLAGLAVIGVTRLMTDTPRTAVEDYFAALADGDAEAALDLVFLGDEIDAAQQPLLTAEALDKRYRPRHVEIGEVTDADPAIGRRARFVDVRYTASGSTVSHRLLVVQDDDDHYRLRAPFVTIVLANAKGRAVTVNGVDMPARTDVVGFPGLFRAEAAGNALLTAASATALPTVADQAAYVAPLDLGTPALAGGAHDRIATEVRGTIDRCAATTTAQTPGCPFALTVWGQITAVTWRVRKYPEILAQPAAATLFGAADGVTITDDGAGTVHWSATYTDPQGAKRTENGDAPFRVNGVARASATGIQITLG
ncbi:hypothetical protein [Actinoplanes sp. NPDC023714]|uniref:hypothetical protein n=1 Tax=Actinoplanes sp. NPDC023714 TaxID=3154322 RepID=UPI0033C652A9